jgi:hypothetical protein
LKLQNEPLISMYFFVSIFVVVIDSFSYVSPFILLKILYILLLFILL